MKTPLFRLVFGWLLLLATACDAQFYSHSTIYSNENVRFTVYLDGQRMNPVPQTRVRCINLTQPYYKLKIVFEDPNIPHIEKRLFYTHDTYGYPVALEHQIKKNKKGQWSLRWKAQESWPGYATPDAVSYQMPEMQAPGETEPREGTSPCGGKILDRSEFDAALESIRRLDADEAKVPVEKQFVSTNCVDVAQLKKLLQVLADEAQKLEMAQYAYAYTVDKGNYFKLNDEFRDPKNIKTLYQTITR